MWIGLDRSGFVSEIMVESAWVRKDAKASIKDDIDVSIDLSVNLSISSSSVGIREKRKRKGKKNSYFITKDLR